MPAALLKFQQGINIGADGEAFLASSGTPVTVENSDNTDVASWRLELLYGPPSSTFEQVPGTPLLLAENAADALPTVDLTPEPLFFGCYRIRLTVWESAGFAGNSDTDIRNIAVPTPNKNYILSPFQKLPDPLPLLGTGDPGEKPHELNFEGQSWGWAGGDYDETTANFRLINDALTELDGLENVLGLPPGGSTGEVVAQSSLANTDVLSFPRNVITTDGTDLLISCGPTIAPATTSGAPDTPGVAYAADGLYWGLYEYPDTGYSVSAVLYAGGNIWAVIEDRSTRDLWWHQITLVDSEVVWTGSRTSMERPGGGQQTTLFNAYASGSRIYIAFNDANGRLIRYDGSTSPPTPVVNSPDALSFGLGPDGTMVHDGGRLYHSSTSGLAVFDEDALTYEGTLHWGYDSQPHPTILGVDLTSPYYGFATDGTSAYFTALDSSTSGICFFRVDATDLVSNPEASFLSSGSVQGMSSDLVGGLIILTANHSGSATFYRFDPSSVGSYSSSSFPVEGTQSGDIVASDVTQRAMASYVSGKHLHLTNAAPYGGPPYSYHAYYLDGDFAFLELIVAPSLTWLPSDEALMEFRLQADIHVDSTSGSDDNNGLTQGTALASLGEARKRIGDKNGDVTIWLWGPVGTSYTITDEGFDRLWQVPRKGFGVLTIRSEVIETVATLTATDYDDQIFLVDESPGFEEYDGNFVALGSAAPMEDGNDPIILNSTTGSSGMIWISDTASMPSPNTLTVWRPGIILYTYNNVTFHGGPSDDSVVQIINLLFIPGSKVEGDILTMKWVRVEGTQYWTNVAFRDSSRIAFAGSQYFEECTTHDSTGSSDALSHCIFATPEFYRCGASGINAAFSPGSPFRISNSRIFVADIHNSDMVLDYIVCTGNVLSEIFDSNIYIRARPIQFRPITLLSNTRVDLEIDDLPSLAMGIYDGSTALATVQGMLDSRLTITWNNNPNMSAFGLGLFESSQLRVNKDLSGAQGIPILDFSDSSNGYLLADGSLIGREGASGHASVVGRDPASGNYTNYVNSVGPTSRKDHNGPILDGGEGIFSYTLPVNREFTVKVLISGSDNASPMVRYGLSYLVKGSTDSSDIVAHSADLQWGATDDDLSDDPLAELAVTFGSDGLDLQVTIENNIGSNTRLSASVYFTADHYAVPEPPLPPLTPSALAAFGTMDFLYDLSGFQTTIPGGWDPNVGGPLYPVFPGTGLSWSNWGGPGLPASGSVLKQPLASPVSGLQSFVAVGQFPANFAGTAECLFALTVGETVGPPIVAPFAVVSGNLVAITDVGNITLVALNPTYIDLKFAIALRLVSGDWYLSLRCDSTHTTASGSDVFTPALALDTLTIGARGDSSSPWDTYVALVGGYSTAHTNGDIELISAEAATQYSIP